MASNEDLVVRTNRLLADIGINDRPFHALSEIQDNASSMFVAVFEQLLSTRLSDVHRRPTSQQHYAENAQRVIDSFRAILPPRVAIPSSVSGDAIAGGDLLAISFLVSLFSDVDRVIRKPAAASTKQSAQNASTEVAEARVSGSLQANEINISSALERSVDFRIDANDQSGSQYSAGALPTSAAASGRGGLPMSIGAGGNSSAAAAEAASTEAPAGSRRASTASNGSAGTAPSHQGGVGQNDIWTGVSPAKVREAAEQSGLDATVDSNRLGTSFKQLPQPSASVPAARPATAIPGPRGQQPQQQLGRTSTTAAVPPAVPASALKATASSRPRTSGSGTSGPIKPVWMPSASSPQQSSHVQPGTAHPRVAVSPARGHAAAVDARKTSGARAAPAAVQSVTGSRRPSSSSLQQRQQGGGGGTLNADAMLDAELRQKQQMASAAAMRRQQSVMKRLVQKNEEELQHIQVMTTAAIKGREAEFRVIEAKAIKAATARAKAAKHERKVLALRTRQTLEDMARHTLGLRIARSSRQASAAAALLKALAAQQRLAAAEKMKMAADEVATELLSAQSRMAWVGHQAAMVNELVLEETAKQVAQRQAAARSQREALQRAVREMRADEGALLARMKEEQAHAEAAFLAQHVESMEGGAGPLDGALTTSARIGDELDTDNDPSRVYTMQRVHKALDQHEQERMKRGREFQRQMELGAGDAGGVLAEAEELEAQARADIAEGQRVLTGITRQLADPRSVLA